MPVDLDPERLLKTKQVRWAWKILGGLFVLVLLVFGTMQAAVALAHEEHTEVDRFPADAIDMIEIQNSSGGSVRVMEASSEDADEVEITSRVSDGFRKTTHSEAVEGNRVLLEASCPDFLSYFCSVDHVVVTPPNVDVLIRAQESVTVTDIDGSVDVETVDARLEVARLDGDVHLQNIAGSITATDLVSRDVDVSSIDGGVYVDLDVSPNSVRAQTVDGDVDVVVPDEADLSYLVDAEARSGNVEMGVRFDPAADRSIVAKTVAGDVTVRYG